MYYYLKGQIVILDEEKAVIDVNGVGYEFKYINSESFVVGENATVYTHHIVREDDEILVGFSSIEEKEFFIELISINGIGAKSAINALRGTTVNKMKEMINNGDIKSLKKLPGIGQKAASQIILDLKGKIATPDESFAPKIKLNQEQEDAKNVLKVLGFKAKEIDEVLSKLPSSLSADQYVEESLKRLSK